MTVPSGTAGQGVNVLSTSIALLCQTFFFGMFSILLPYSVYVVKRGMGARTHWLLYCSLFAFALSAAFWGVSVANLLLRIHGFFIHPSTVLASNLDIYGPAGNAVVLINYVITDGIVLWRAWVLCRTESGRFLYAPTVLFTLTCLAISGTISIRVTLTVLSAQGRRKPGTHDGFTHAIDVTQVAGLSLSLLTNLSATTLIALKTWKHRVAMRKFIRAAQRVGNRSETILALLVESGFIYCLIGIVVIIATITRLPEGGTLGDLLLPSAAQITGIYPTIVLIVVSLRATMNETVFDTVGSSTLHFARPVRSARKTGHSGFDAANPASLGIPPIDKNDRDKPLPQIHATEQLSTDDRFGDDVDEVPLVHVLDSPGRDETFSRK